MSKGLFITGTDTDAGKTYISSLIVRALRNERVDAVGFKPICCGDRNDALEMANASGFSDGEIEADDEILNKLNPVWMKTPAAPHVASMFENKPVEKDVLLNAHKALKNEHACVTVSYTHLTLPTKA